MKIVPPVSILFPVPTLTKTPQIQAPQSSTGAPRTAETRKVEKAARQFETQLLTSVLTALENSVGSSFGGSEDTGAGEQYKTMATQGLASAWAAAGGIGIARMIGHALSQSASADLSSVPALPLKTLPPVHF